MSEFIVKIDTAKLNQKQAAAISGAIQGAVMRELGRLDLAPARTPFTAITAHPEWLGLWLRSLKDLQRTPNAVLKAQVEQQR